MMTSAVAQRYSCLKSVLLRRKEVKHLSLADGLSGIAGWYGFRRRLINRRLIVRSIDSQLDWIAVGAYGIAWPKGRPLARLVGALAEQWAPSNPHFYFADPTRVCEGDFVADVGATEGSFAVECLINYRAAKVWCFEPDPLMTLALQSTADRNGLTGRITVVQAAVTRASGLMQFVENIDDPLASYCIQDMTHGKAETVSTNTRTVSAISLDDWAAEAGIAKLDYLKIDAEGSDLRVLEGAENCLKRWRPAIAVTTYHHPDHCNEMIEYLSSLSLGYRFRVKGIVLFDSTPRPVMLHAASRD